MVKLSNTLSAGGYSERTVRNYTTEVRFLFSYFNELDPLSIGNDEIITYINYLRSGLKVSCIDSAAMQIKVVQGKGNKDRFTILPKFILEDLRKYYRSHRTKEYLFEGYIPDRPMHERAIGHMVTQCMKVCVMENGWPRNAATITFFFQSVSCKKSLKDILCISFA